MIALTLNHFYNRAIAFIPNHPYNQAIALNLNHFYHRAISRLRGCEASRRLSVIALAKTTIERDLQLNKTG